MFYDGSMQNIKEHTADFDVADFEPEANEHSYPLRAPWGPRCMATGSVNGPQAMLATAPSIESQAMLTIVATVKLLVASRVKLDAMLGPQEEGRAEDRVGATCWRPRRRCALKIGPKKDDVNCVEGHSKLF